MILLILKVIVALYTVTKLLAAKGASKEFFEIIDFKANGFLVSLKNEEVYSVLWATHRTLFKFNIALILLVFVLSVLIKPLSSTFILNWTIVFFSSLILTISVPWNLDHSKYVKSYFFSPPIVLLLALPMLSLPLNMFYGIDILGPLKIAAPFSLLNEWGGDSEWKFALLLFSIFFMIYIVIPYIIFWLILLPIFYTLMLCTKFTQLFLALVHKHLNENLLAVMMGVATVILAVL